MSVQLYGILVVPTGNWSVAPEPQIKLKRPQLGSNGVSEVRKFASTTPFTMAGPSERPYREQSSGKVLKNVSTAMPGYSQLTVEEQSPGVTLTVMVWSPGVLIGASVSFMVTTKEQEPVFGTLSSAYQVTVVFPIGNCVPSMEPALGPDTSAPVACQKMLGDPSQLSFAPRWSNSPTVTSPAT